MPFRRRASSDFRVWSERASSSEKTATVRIPSSAAARMMRIAITARLAIKRLLGIMFLSSLSQDTGCLDDFVSKACSPDRAKVHADGQIGDSALQGITTQLM